MGKLQRLELFNFKSYKGHHILQFGDSYFTSIIGPNGSGKSNSMDAISFVLGIKSSHLRSTHLRDLVYRGRVLRTSKIGDDGGVIENGNSGTNSVNGHDEDEEEEPDTQAGASQRNDPNTAWVMAVYEDDAGKEQKWKRSITSSGQSEYRINNRIVGAKQYNEALEAENILIKARNFLVFQGDVEAIANQAPKDVTRLLEQISGSVEYKADYERLKVEMEKAAEDQAFKLNQRRAINSEIKQYQEQKREAESYQRKLDERDQAIVTHVLWKLFHFQRVMEESGAEIQKHQDELKEFRRGAKKHEQRLEDARKDQAKIGSRVSKVERQIKDKQKTIDTKTSELLPIDEKISQLNDRLKENQKVLSEVSKQRDEESTAHDGLQKNLAQIEKAQEKWEADFQQTTQQSGRTLSNADLKEYHTLRIVVNIKTTTDQVKINEIDRQLKTEKETANNLRAKVDNAEAQVEKLREEIKKLRDCRENAASEATKLTDDVDAKRKEYYRMASEQQRASSLRYELEGKLRAVLNEIQENDDGKRETEKERMIKDSISTLKRTYPGVRGRLVELCKPKQDKFRRAVETAIGRHLDSIVVDTDKTAKECIQYMNDNKIGIFTFIPLDSIQVEAVIPNVKGTHPGMRLAVDAIDCNSIYDRAVAYACSSTMICDNMQVAKSMVYDRKVDAKAITLDGTVIHKGGLMTGGRSKHDGKRRFDEGKLSKLRAQEEKYKKEIEELPNSKSITHELEALSTQVYGLEQKLKLFEDEVKSYDRNLASKEKELDAIKRELADLAPKVADASKSVEDLDIALKSYRDAVSQVEDEVFATFCKRLGFVDIREYTDSQGPIQAKADEERTRFSKHIANIKGRLEFKATGLDRTKKRIEALKTTLATDKNLIQSHEEQKRTIQEEIDVLTGELEQLQEDVEKLNEQNAEKVEKVAEQRRALKQRSGNVDSTLNTIAGLEAEAQRTASQRYALLRKCKMDEVKIPLATDSAALESLPLDDMLRERDPDAMDIDDTAAVAGASATEIRDFGIKVDFDHLGEDLKEDDSPQQESNLQEAIISLTSELDKMAPNMRAVERLEGTEARAKTTDREFAAAKTAFQRAKDDFDEVKNKRLELFDQAFNHIADSIGTVYRELTRSAAAPLGGQAYLDKEDEDEPYLAGLNYHAMPPLKRFRDMEHLSGGEKTMAALALLFAVHSYQPSPFFVLDEVDAALDNANVAKIANYIRDHAGPGMQFIVISLKTGLFERSETLVGVMRDQGINSSRTLTLDLRKYQEVAVR